MQTIIPLSYAFQSSLKWGRGPKPSIETCINWKVLRNFVSYNIKASYVAVNTIHELIKFIFCGVDVYMHKYQMI